MQYFILGERFQLYLSCVWCFMHMAFIGSFGQHICNSIVHKIKTTLRNDELATVQRQTDGSTKLKYAISDQPIHCTLALVSRLREFTAPDARESPSS